MTFELHYLYLIFASVTLFYLFSQISFRKKYGVHELFSEKYSEEIKKSQKKERSFIRNSALFQWLSAEKFIQDAKQYDWHVSSREYWVYILIGGSVLSIILSVFHLGFFSNIGFLGGIILPKILVSINKLRYKVEVEDKLIVYMKAVSNAMPVYGNAVDALESVIPLIADPIKSDVEKALSILRTGQTVRDSFTEMNSKYQYKDLVFFHDILDVAHANGGEFHRVLITTADEFEQKKVLQAKLTTSMAQAKRSFIQNAIILLAILVGFKFFASEIYDDFFTTLIGKVILIYLIVSTVVATLRVHKHSQFDPSEAEKA